MKIYIKAKRKRAIKTAKELFYPLYVIEKLKSAATENELYRILHDAREAKI